MQTAKHFYASKVKTIDTFAFFLDALQISIFCKFGTVSASSPLPC